MQDHKELVWTKASTKAVVQEIRINHNQEWILQSFKGSLFLLKKYTDSYVFLLLYVDDMLIAGSSMREINNLKTRLSTAFEMKDLGPAK